MARTDVSIIDRSVPPTDAWLRQVAEQGEDDRSIRAALSR